VLRILSDFGDAAGWLIAAVVLFAYGRRIIRENEKAHAAITENVQENRRQITDLDQKIDTVATTLDQKIDAVGLKLDQKIDAVGLKIDAVAKDVSFLAGRQAERDRA
jgi:phage host-nuclease inhibitor protein Gam